MLTQLQERLLRNILSGTGLPAASEDALRFRAANEDLLDELDELEHRRLLIRRDNRYTLSLIALADMHSSNIAADRIFYLCGHLFEVLRRMYKENPGQKITVDFLAETAEFPKSQVQRALSYLVDTPIWTQHTGIPSSIVDITLDERILRHKDFDSVIGALRDKQKRKGTQSEVREKQQKFGVLDSPTLLKSDLAKPCGILGRAVLYLDLDDFKKINTKLTEVVVDRLILPPIHALLAKCVERVGSAYGEGGDEFTILLPNSSEAMALEFAQALRTQVCALRFEGSAREIRLSASIGVAHGLADVDGQLLLDRANGAKNHAKASGKNSVAAWAEPNSRVL